MGRALRDAGRGEQPREAMERTADKSPTSLKWRLLAAGLVVAAGLALLKLTGATEFLTFDTLARNREWLLAEVDRLGLLAPLVYALAYAAATALSLPGALLLTLAAGFLFGWKLGTLVAVSGATLGGTVVFLIAKTALGDSLRARAGPSVRKFEEGFRRDALSYLLVLRLVPLFPFWLVNLVPAFLGVPLRIFVVATFFGIIPATLVYASIGNGLGAVFDGGGQPDYRIILEPRFILPLLGLALLALVPALYRRLRGEPPAATAERE
jgi:uncharacterized membrane protein YdjX (TVP38/TMEM64 family)